MSRQRRRASNQMADRSSAAKTELARAHGLASCKERVLALAARSKLPDKTLNLPRFDIDELELGQILGQGQFGTISEVTAIHLCDRDHRHKVNLASSECASLNDSGNLSYRFSDNDEDSSTMSESTTDIMDDIDGAVFLTRQGLNRTSSKAEKSAKAEAEEHHQKAARNFLARTALREDRARYAVKLLSPSVMINTESFLQGVTDMAAEVRVLSNMDHPHIIKLRGHAKVEPYNEYYFIVMDRLYDSLEVRLEQWEKRRNPRRNMVNRLLSQAHKDKKETGAEKQVRVEQLQVACNLADALCYVHKLNIVYRDIKSENVGFDIRDDVRLFDFGLSKELSLSQKDANGTYALTQLGVGGLEGNSKYIAPEIANGDRYNQLCDSYSFGVLVWQILACQTPYMNCETPDKKNNMESFKLKVWDEKVQQRPLLDEKWPLSLQNLLQKSWTHCWNERCTMRGMRDILERELAAMGHGRESRMDRIRRSTHIFKRDTSSPLVQDDDSLYHESFEDVLATDRRASMTMNTAVNQRLSDRSLTIDPREHTANSRKIPADPREYMVHSRQNSCRSINSAMSAAECREERYEEFVRKHSTAGKRGPLYPGEEEEVTAEREVRHGCTGTSFGEMAMGGLALPAGVLAANQMEDFQDNVFAADREMVESSKELKRSGSSRSLRRQHSNRSLGSTQSHRSNTSRKSHTSQRGKKGDRSKKKHSSQSSGSRKNSRHRRRHSTSTLDQSQDHDDRSCQSFNGLDHHHPGTCRTSQKQHSSGSSKGRSKKTTSRRQSRKGPRPHLVQRETDQRQEDSHSVFNGLAVLPAPESCSKTTCSVSDVSSDDDYMDLWSDLSDHEH